MIACMGLGPGVPVPCMQLEHQVPVPGTGHQVTGHQVPPGPNTITGTWCSSYYVDCRLLCVK